jgi:hypothetical protein
VRFCPLAQSLGRAHKKDKMQRDRARQLSDHNAYLRRRHGSVDTNTVADPRPAPGLLSPSRSPTKRQAHRVRSSSALPERPPSQFAQGKGETSDLFDADSVGSSDVDEGDQERLFSTSLGQVHHATPKHATLLSAALLLRDWLYSNPAPRLLSTLNLTSYAPRTF